MYDVDVCCVCHCAMACEVVCGVVMCDIVCCCLMSCVDVCCVMMFGVDGEWRVTMCGRAALCECCMVMVDWLDGCCCMVVFGAALMRGVARLRVIVCCCVMMCGIV